MLYRTALLRIERIEMDRGQGHHRIILRMEFRRSRISEWFAMTPTIAGAAYFDRCLSSAMRSAIAFARGVSLGASGYLAFRQSSSSFSSPLRLRLNLNLTVR